MVKTNIWSWAKDERLCKEFERLNLVEILILGCGVGLLPFLEIVGFVFGFDHIPSLMLLKLEKFFWWTGFIVVITRTNILRDITHWPPNWFLNLKEVDWRVYTFVALLIIFYVFLAFWPGVLEDLLWKMDFLVGDKEVHFLKIWEGVLSVLQQEIEYRIVLYYSLCRVFGRSFAFFFTSLLFGFYHDADFFYRTATFSGGAIFSILTVATGSVVPSVILHSVINLSALFLSMALK